jgi:hypothetical protein
LGKDVTDHGKFYRVSMHFNHCGYLGDHFPVRGADGDPTDGQGAETEEKYQ